MTAVLTEKRSRDAAMLSMRLSMRQPLWVIEECDRRVQWQSRSYVRTGAAHVGAGSDTWTHVENTHRGPQQTAKTFPVALIVKRPLEPMNG